jgi:hypothetical protein
MLAKRIGIVALVCVLCWFGTQTMRFCGTVWGQYDGMPQGVAPQVVVRQQAELPKCVVDFAPLEDPANPARKMRVITVVDTEAKKIAVYHEELATGKVWWLSTRSIQPDLLIDQFNATQPLPSEVDREVKRLQNKNSNER